jgi:ABC-2 type transport system ATP-binding protein
MLSEVEQTVDDVVIIANGRRVAAGTVAELHGSASAFVRSAESARLADALRYGGLTVTPRDNGLQVDSSDLVRIGDLALAAGVPIHELRAEQTRLEELFFNLTESAGDRNRGQLPADPAPSADSPGGHPSAGPEDLPPPTGSPVSTAPSREEGLR